MKPHIYAGPQGDNIVRADKVNDLGVTLSDDASFTGHVESIGFSCKRLTGYELRTFKSRDKTTMVTL